MDLYGERKNARKTIVFLCFIMMILVGADLLQKDTLISAKENRILQSKPKMAKKTLLNGEYMERYGIYLNDQFVGRDNWITIQNTTDRLFQKTVMNDVYLAKDGYLIERHLPEDFPQEKMEKSLSNLEAFLEDFPQAKVMLVPTADNVLTDKLPAFAPYFDQEAFLEQAKERIGEENFVNVLPILREHADEEIYYRTDSHWTTLGAYYAYEAFARSYPKPPRWYLHGELQTVKEDFQGDLYAKVKQHAGTDKITVFPRVMEADSYRITYDEYLSRTDFYEEKYLKDGGSYSFFLDDTHAIVEIERESHLDGTLLVIKDSYANAMIPLLAHHYKKIYVVDLNYFDANVTDYMQNCDIYGNMDVLVLYNCVNFIESFEYQSAETE